MTGKGEAFPEDDETGTVYEPAPIYKVGPAKGIVDKGARGFDLADATQMAIRVLDSNTSYAEALFLNIFHFDRAIKAEARITNLESRFQTLESRLSDLEQENADLKNRLDQRDKPTTYTDSAEAGRWGLSGKNARLDSANHTGPSTPAKKAVAKS